MILLNFNPAPPETKPLRNSLSGVVWVGRYLWVAGDETTSIERLSTEDGVNYGDHRSFELGELIDLPGRKEIDIEGMDYQDGFLWIVGSHGAKRALAEKGLSDKENIQQLAAVKRKGNRYILARIPICGADDPRPEGRGERLRGDDVGNALIDALSGRGGGEADPHLAPFLSIPGKDNGFDIEGLAVAGERIFLGLRGPVLRGWAIILEVAVKEDNGRLALRKIGPQGRRYRKHFLQLGGLGVRDLCIDGDDLLILAEPTMVLDGPVTVFRWKDALAGSGESLVWADRLEAVVEIPYGREEDHAEGMTLVTGADGRKSLLIVCDAPGSGRCEGESRVRADLFALG